MNINSVVLASLSIVFSVFLLCGCSTPPPGDVEMFPVTSSDNVAPGGVFSKPIPRVSHSYSSSMQQNKKSSSTSPPLNDYPPGHSLNATHSQSKGY